MGGFLLYSGSGKLYIDRLAENERVFIAESLEIEKIACRKFDIYVNIDIGFRA
jgi:hypothetical protein